MSSVLFAILRSYGLSSRMNSRVAHVVRAVGELDENRTEGS